MTKEQRRLVERSLKKNGGVWVSCRQDQERLCDVCWFANEPALATFYSYAQDTRPLLCPTHARELDLVW